MKFEYKLEFNCNCTLHMTKEMTTLQYLFNKDNNSQIPLQCPFCNKIIYGNIIERRNFND